MNATKIKLSATELDLVTNADFILTKNSIICKVVDTFSVIANNMKEIAAIHYLPNCIYNTTPKISKGENYLGLPWVMLDYPRIFNTHDTFAIRTFFWWGNCISITLQLSGKYQQQFQQTIFQKLALANTDWQLCCNKDAWQHHFEASNYKPFNNFSLAELNSLCFIKLAKKIPLDEWDNMEIFLKANFEQVIQLLAS